MSTDLGFLKRNQASVEEGEDEELFGVSPSSTQSHFVNRIEEAARATGEAGQELFSEGFLEYSVKVEESQNRWDFSFDCSLRSISNVGENEVLDGQKGFLKLNTIDHKLKEASTLKTPSKFISQPKSNKLEFTDQKEDFWEPRKTDFGRNKSNNAPDFIGFSDAEAEPKENQRNNLPRTFPDFENIFNESKYKNIDCRNNKLEFVSRERIRKSTNQFNNFARLSRNQKEDLKKRKWKTELSKKPEIRDSLLPEFDNGNTTRVPEKSTRKNSVDFLI